ncbi:MAG: alpha/beta hydrolase, partial [Gammaproteobacteria bacterium]
LKSTDRWQDFPPVITFQSVVDGTVSVPAVLDLHQVLPSGRSQLVLFDVNRNSIYSPFLRNDGSDVLRRMGEEDWSGVDVTIVRNQDVDDRNVVADRRCGDSAGCAALTSLESQWPRNVFSLSHVAIPFPPDDPLYGSAGAAFAPSGYNLGNANAMGERQVLVIPAEDSNRLRYNPFFAYLKARALEFCGACETGRD